MTSLKIEDIDKKYRPKIYTQDYKSKSQIKDVRIIPLKNFVGEEGDFSELLRIDEKGEFDQLPGFKLAQVNRVSLIPNSVKAWHLHFKQNEIWYLVPSGNILVGLCDLREDSETKGKIMRIVLGDGDPKMLYIPKGVAHGSCNIVGQKVELFYFTDQKFNPSDPDERRLHWDILGKDFWNVQRD